MRRILTTLILTALLAGCETLAPFQEDAADKVADGVGEYCSNTDATFREEFRRDVNEQAAPNSIRVECAE